MHRKSTLGNKAGRGKGGRGRGRAEGEEEGGGGGSKIWEQNGRTGANADCRGRGGRTLKKDSKGSRNTREKVPKFYGRGSALVIEGK